MNKGGGGWWTSGLCCREATKNSRAAIEKQVYAITAGQETHWKVDWLGTKTNLRAINLKTYHTTPPAPIYSTVYQTAVVLGQLHDPNSLTGCSWTLHSAFSCQTYKVWDDFWKQYVTSNPTNVTYNYFAPLLLTLSLLYSHLQLCKVPWNKALF